MIPITYLVGDATEPFSVHPDMQHIDVETSHGPRIIAHVCNDLGGWGAGFVLAISAKWSIPEAQYRSAMRAGNLMLGDIQVFGVDPRANILVCNMVAQHGYRASDSNPVPLDYNALAECCAKLRTTTIASIQGDEVPSLHMPRIGCGLAGGTWDKVEPIITEFLSAYDIPVYVYSLP